MKAIKHWLIPAVLLGTMAYAVAEDFTLTTYYPSPRGVYKELRSTDATYLATDSASVTANVGIGTTNPQAKLQVGGGASAACIIIDDNVTAGVSPTITQAAANAVFGGGASNADAWHTHAGSGGAPGSWTCAVRTDTVVQAVALALCQSTEKVMAGGCFFTTGELVGSFPQNQGWECHVDSQPTFTLTAYANCCK